MKLLLALSIAVLLMTLPLKVHAVPVRIQGFVCKLQGTPHDSPRIRVTVRTARGTEYFDDVDSTGFFNITVPESDVPSGNVRLAIEAAGTSILGGRRQAVRANPTMIGVAGKIDPAIANRLADGKGEVVYQIVLVVPKDTPRPCYRCIYNRKCLPIRGCRESRKIGRS